VKYWEIIADRLSKAGWSLGWVSAIDSQGRTIWIADAHKGMTLPGQALRVDLRPAFRKPLADVTPKFRAVSIGYTFTPQR
jgi:hypothetical protein